jgi:hypothetical protein
VRVTSGEPEGDCTAEGVTLPSEDADGDCADDDDGVARALPLPVPLADALPLGETAGDDERVASGERDGEGSGDCVAVPRCEAESEAAAEDD